ncbi:MAG: FkbM family methyltransferase [Candidatus Obscuribacterales bacterium]|nr:FkbM family methyltransferase [Candidatus Obscuribacterales bacterium]
MSLTLANPITIRDMFEIGSKRFWRSLAVKYLPECLKSPLRKRLHGWTDSQPPFNVSFQPSDRGLLAKITNDLDLYINEEFKPNVDYQFVQNADCIEESRAFIALAKEAKVLFDAGAYAGLFSLVFCRMGKDKRAIAFEPSPVMKPKIETLIAINQLETQLRLKPKAIGSEEGSLNLALEDTGFVQILPSDSSTKTMAVEVTTLDLECKRLNVYPDLLKIDVEGFELEALKGAEELLAKKKPAICLELHLNYLEERGIKPKLVTDELEKHDYRFYSCAGQELSAAQIYDSVKPVVRFIAK